jgi:mannose-6-phosphate isomerase-like protein (cupin superfamily)
MRTSEQLGACSIIRAGELEFVPDDAGVAVATPVSPSRGSLYVTLRVARVPAGASWSPPESEACENVAVVYDGRGGATVGSEGRELVKADAVYAPTGHALTLTGSTSGLTAYVWASTLLPGRSPSPTASWFSSLWNETTQLRGFAGTGQVDPSDLRATMNFVFWPGTGSCQACLHCGIQQPGETFNVHLHTEADEAFFAFEGVGQMYVADHWVDVEAGDVLYAAPRVLHGARNPHTGPGARRFVTCGGPLPWDPALYAAAGVSDEVR